MSKGKQGRFFSHIRDMAVRPQKLFDQARALESLHAVLYDWTISSDELTWGPNAADILNLSAKALPSTGRAFAAMFEPGNGLSRADAISADAVVSHPRGMPYHLRYAMRLDDERLIMVEDNGRWFADGQGRPIKACGSLMVDRTIDNDAMPFQMVQRSSFLRAVANGGKARGALHDVTILVFALDSGRHDTVPTGLHDCTHDSDILHEVLDRLREMMRHHDRFLVQPNGTIALALTGCRQEDVPKAMVRLQETMEARPFRIMGGDAAVHVRIGAASAPKHATSASMLLNHAEDALRNTFASGHPTALFNHVDHARTQWGKSLVSYLDTVEMLSDDALASHLVPSLRPMIDSRSRLPALALAGAGKRTGDCLVQPAHDLNLSAQEAGLTMLLDRQVFDLACAELATSPLDALIVPVASSTAAAPEWPMFLAERLGASPHVASRLIVGIPEKFAAHHPDLLHRRLDAMKALGIGVAIIDYGSGFIPCHRLQNLPVDLVAIDGALIQNTSFSTKNRFYVRGLIEGIQRLDIATAALWVEDERTASLLTDWGVDYLEGRVRTAQAQRSAASRKTA